MRNPEEGRAIVLDHPSLITRGNGRAYGDAALNTRCTLSTLREQPHPRLGICCFRRCYL